MAVFLINYHNVFCKDHNAQNTHLLTILLMLVGAKVLLMGTDPGEVSPVCTPSV